MNYTIAVLEDVHGGLQLEVTADGNKRCVMLYNKVTKELTTKKFDSLEKAYILFEKLSKHIIFGEYSYNDKKSMLA